MERIDPKMSGEWNERLAKEGLPEITEVEKLPAEAVGETVSKNEEEILAFAMEEVLQEYAVLPPKLQEDIIIDIKSKKEEGMKFSEISNRVNVLVQKAKELVQLNSDDSDKEHKPKPTPEESKLQNEQELEVENIDDLIKKLEELRYKDIIN